PRSARVLASSTGSITLAWDIPESTGCTELEYYRIERDTGQGFEPVANVSTPIQTYTDTGDLSPGQMYIYRIAARNDALDYFGPHSSHVTAFAASLPGMPRNLGYVTSTRTAITLMWDPPADTGGAMVDFYRVQADDGLGGAFGDVAVVAGTYTTIEHLESKGYLTPGRPYRFRVAAETVVGTGPYTAVFQQVVAAVPSNPQTPIVETIPGYMDRVRVTWAEPSDNGGSLTLGYKVTFDGQCDRYDGTSVASITSVQIICVTGQHHLITVAARNVVGWGGPSPSVSRVCGAEPDAPADLRLKMNVPSQPLDMVDLRTPSSMTLTWNAGDLRGQASEPLTQLRDLVTFKVPTVDGGNPVTSYQLYRDAGDSSGIYTLAYAGTMASVTLHSLSNGKTYRFYAVAVNDVGPGARTSVFSAEMRCTPRSLVAAPYKVSGSPWSIAIAWPETADNCGRAVQGYRVYRDGNLVFPLSNEFHAPPALVGAISSDSVTLRITAKESGSAWAILVKDDDKASRGSEGDKSRGETLSECLKSLVNSGSKWQDLSRTNEVHFVDGEVVTKYSSIGVDFSLPLLCTDVTWTRIPTPDFDSMQQTPFDRAETEEIPEVKFLIGLAPRWKRLQMAPLECFDEGTDEFWVLCASFQVGTPEMESFLSVLQRSGALRWDIDEEYVFHRQVIGRGSSSISRRGLLRRSFRELSTLVDESHSEEEPASPPCDPVAIKITKHPESDEEAQSIVNEVRFLAASCQHPNIVQLLGTFCAKWRGKSLWLLALELCSGGRLQDHVKIYGHLEPMAGEGASVGLFSAVAHLHGRRILHRDIRPQNILLAENLRPVLVNFGNACCFEDVSCLSARRTARADGYTAPEAIDGRLGTQGPASDVFSTAATVLLMLTGIEPCNEAKSAEQTLTGNARLDELAASKLSQSTAALLQRLLARHARKRPTACQACMMLHEEAAEEVQELSVFEKAVTALSMTLAATGGADRGSHVGLASIDESEALEELMQSAVEGCSSFAGGAPTLPESDLAGGYSASGLAQPPPPPGGAGPAPLPLEPTSPTSSPSSSSFVPQPPSGPSPRKGGRGFMGRILHVVDPSRFDTLYTPAPTSTAPKVKAGMDAVGRLSVPLVVRFAFSALCLFNSAAGAEAFRAGGSVVNRSGRYSVFAYVESYDALDNDGSLYGPLRFQVPATSNSFAARAPRGSGSGCEVPPEIQMPVTKDGLAVTFTPTASAGWGYAMIAAEADYATLTVANVKAFMSAVGDAGMAWAVVIPELEAISATVASIKAATGAMCSTASFALTSGMQSFTIDSCSLSLEVLYKAMVYIEDGMAENDGSFAAVDVMVPSNGPALRSTTNAFSAYPKLVSIAGALASSDGVTFTVTASGMDGRLWAMVVPDYVENCMTVRAMKFLRDALCSRWNYAINDQPQSISIMGCNLKGGDTYRLFVYVEGTYNGDDGVIAPAVQFVVPHTNTFLMQPTVTNSLVSPDGFQLTFQAEMEGAVWAMVVANIHEQWVDPNAIKLFLLLNTGVPWTRRRGWRARRCLPGTMAAMTPEIWDELSHLREDRQKMLDAAEKAKQEGDEGGAEFQMMLAGEISEKIEELESKHGSAPPLPGAGGNNKAIVPESKARGPTPSFQTVPPRIGVGSVPPPPISGANSMINIPPGVAGALAMRPGMSLPGLGPGMPPVVLPPGIQPGMQPPGMPPMPAAIPGPPSLTQQQAMEYDATKAASTALEPEVIELVHYFKIGDRHARMLNEQLKRRNNTYEEDIASLYEILKGAKNPADLLMVSIRWMEQGVFRGCLTPNPKVEKASKKYKLDAPSACKLAEALESREDPDEALDKICEHLAASNKPSSLVMIMLKDIKNGADIQPCTKTPAIGSYLHKKETEKSRNRTSRSRERERDRGFQPRSNRASRSRERRSPGRGGAGRRSRSRGRGGHGHGGGGHGHREPRDRGGDRGDRGGRERDRGDRGGAAPRLHSSEPDRRSLQPHWHREALAA
ncbi:TTN, partial [Symbiodinium sp. KB8]